MSIRLWGRSFCNGLTVGIESPGRSSWLTRPLTRMFVRKDYSSISGIRPRSVECLTCVSQRRTTSSGRLYLLVLRRSKITIFGLGFTCTLYTMYIHLSDTYEMKEVFISIRKGFGLFIRTFRLGPSEFTVTKEEKPLHKK